MGLKHSVRRQVVDCVIEGRVKRFTRLEMLALIEARTGQALSFRALDAYIRSVKQNAPERLQQLKESRYDFLDEVFKSLDGIDRLIQESWSLYHRNANNAQLQLNCIHALHQLEITRSNIIDVLPAYGGIKLNGDSEKTAILPHLEQVQQRGNTQKVF